MKPSHIQLTMPAPSPHQRKMRKLAHKFNDWQQLPNAQTKNQTLEEDGDIERGIRLTRTKFKKVKRRLTGIECVSKSTVFVKYPR